MISTPKAIVQILVLGFLGGWLGGVCINASDGILAAMQSITPLKAALVGLLSTLSLSIPWAVLQHMIFVLFPKIRIMRKPYWWLSGAMFGVMASVMAVLYYFLLWPYDGHGRMGIHKTVVTIVGVYPIPVFGIGGLTGIFASSWIRPTQEGEQFWLDWLLPLAILAGMFSILGTVAPLENDEPEQQLSPEEIQCCQMAFQAFVKKVGVSYAVFETEKYCEVECPLVNECLDRCNTFKETCSLDEGVCKSQHRECVLSCPIE